MSDYRTLQPRPITERLKLGMHVTQGERLLANTRWVQARRGCWHLPQFWRVRQAEVGAWVLACCGVPVRVHAEGNFPDRDEFCQACYVAWWENVFGSPKPDEGLADG